MEFAITAVEKSKLPDKVDIKFWDKFIIKQYK